MERIVWFLFWYFVLIHLKTGSESCPLQCKCSSMNNQTLKALCNDAKFDRLPALPEKTDTFKMTGYQCKVNTIQAGFWKQYRYLQTVYLRTIIPIKLESDTFQGLGTMDTFGFRSKYKIDLPENIFNDMNSRVMVLYMNNPDILKYLCSQTNLEELDISKNMIDEISFPPCFANMKKIARLQMDNNDIREIRQLDFFVFSNSKLKELHFASCPISTIHKDAFSELSNLKQLIFSKNRLTSLPRSLLSGLFCLEIFELSYNYFTSLPCDMFSRNLSSLNYINFQSNSKVKNQYICEEFSSLKSLDRITLAETRIKMADKMSMSAIKNVSRLELTVHDIFSDAFSEFNKLQSLTLEGGKGDATVFTNAVIGLSDTPITALSASSLSKLYMLTDTLFQPMNKSNLLSLTMISCGIRSIETGTFSHLLKLRKLDLSSNDLTNILNGTFQYLVNLRTLRLSNNKISIFMPTYRYWSVQPSVSEIDINMNKIDYVNSYVIRHLANLTVLDLGENQITTLHEKALDNPNLRILNLSGNNLNAVLPEALMHLPELTAIFIKHNRISFQVKYGIPFGYNVKLTEIHLQGATLADNFESGMFGLMFQNTTELLHLEFESGNINVLPESIFETCKKLNFISFSENKLKSWDPNTFKGLDKLTNLVFASNQIMSLTKAHFKFLMSLHELNLQNNPLLCNCDLLWFRDWIPKVNIYLPNIRMYKCAEPPVYRGTPLLDFDLPVTECQSFVFLKLSVTFTAAVALVLIATALVYRFRFEINLLIFQLRSRQSRLLDQSSEREQFDGFIVYASGDLQWIIDNLIPEIEIGRGYKLCIEDRDWLPGVTYIENIMTSIEVSRKVLLLISPNFTSASWCEEVLLLAQSHLAGRDRNNLIPIVLQEPEAEQMTPALRAILSSFSCLYWPNIPKLEKHFWRALAKTMKT